MTQDGFKRKLTAILSADVEGYSRLMGEDEDLRDAIELARRIRHNSGRRRQLQYIGKLMGSIDPEPIRAALQRLRQT